MQVWLSIIMFLVISIRFTSESSCVSCAPNACRNSRVLLPLIICAWLLLCNGFNGQKWYSETVYEYQSQVIPPENSNLWHPSTWYFHVFLMCYLQLGIIKDHSNNWVKLNNNHVCIGIIEVDKITTLDYFATNL